MAIEHSNLTSIHRMAYVSNVDPGAVGAYKGWIDTNSTPYILKVRNAGNSAWVQVGEILTGSNVGTGENIFKTKNGQVFEFKTLVADAGVVLTPAANTLTIGLNPSAISGPQVNQFYTVRWVLTQSGTGNPTGFEVVNNTANLISWTRTALGVYEGTFDGNILPVGQTAVQVTYGNNSNNPAADGIIACGRRKSVDIVQVRCYSIAGALADANCTDMTVDISFPV